MYLLLSLFAAAPVLKPCTNTLFTLNSLSLDPHVPLPGDKVALIMDYTVPVGYVTTGGTAKYELTYNFLPLSPTTEPLCQNIPCPLGPGTYKNSSIADWPTGLTGSLKTVITWTDVAGVKLLCFTIDAKL
jgi:hypothetical protein